MAPGSTPGGSSPDQKWSCPLQAASAAYAFQKYIDSMLAELTQGTTVKTKAKSPRRKLETHIPEYFAHAKWARLEDPVEEDKILLQKQAEHQQMMVAERQVHQQALVAKQQALAARHQ